jgi:L-aminopeptidase/D-esterase-like protein
VGKLFGIDRSMKGGVGTASVQAAGFTVAAMVVCNAVGDVVDPSTGQLVAGARSADGASLEDTVQALLSGTPRQRPITPPDAGTNTTIGVIATDAVLSKAQVQRLARVGHDGLARTINPVHTPLDGDTLFALATGTQPAPADMLLLSVMAAEATARATLNAVRMANGNYFKAL